MIYTQINDTYHIQTNEQYLQPYFDKTLLAISFYTNQNDTFLYFSTGLAAVSGMSELVRQ